jgi:hypothetical protein
VARTAALTVGFTAALTVGRTAALTVARTAVRADGIKLGVLAGVARMALFTADRWLIKDFFCTDMTSSVKLGF